MACSSSTAGPWPRSRFEFSLTPRMSNPNLTLAGASAFFL
jgi:hypothetical protein